MPEQMAVGLSRAELRVTPPIHHHHPAADGVTAYDTDGVLPGRERMVNHADGSHTHVSDWTEYIFEHGRVGDWWWSEDTDGNRILWLVVPDHRPESAAMGPQIDSDPPGELLLIYPSHAGPSERYPSGNWAEPGPVNGWDGDLTEPTLHPSIFPGGSTDAPGWHGFFEKGRLRTVG